MARVNFNWNDSSIRLTLPNLLRFLAADSWCDDSRQHANMVHGLNAVADWLHSGCTAELNVAGQAPLALKPVAGHVAADSFQRIAEVPGDAATPPVALRLLYHEGDWTIGIEWPTEVSQLKPAQMCSLLARLLSDALLYKGTLSREDLKPDGSEEDKIKANRVRELNTIESQPAFGDPGQTLLTVELDEDGGLELGAIRNEARHYIDVGDSERATENLAAIVAWLLK